MTCWKSAVHLVRNVAIDLGLGRCNSDALDLSKALLVSSLEIGFQFADPLPPSDPPLSISCFSLVRDVIHRRPIRSVIVMEIHLAAIRRHQLGRWDVLAEVFVELQLLAREGVDEGRDELKEAPYRPRNCTLVLAPLLLGLM